MPADYVLVASDVDPVARDAVRAWGTPPSEGVFVDGSPLRRLAPGCLLLRRPGPHIHDEQLDLHLPADLREQRVPLVFPSIHRSEKGVASITVHPIGNPGPEAKFGGRPRTLVPTVPELMTATLRRLSEESASVGVPVTFEATHHGPELTVPAFFVEVFTPAEAQPLPAAVRLLTRLLPQLVADREDRVALAVGGGHYAPHFTDLVRERRWAIGHILSRHVLETVDRATAEMAHRMTPGAEGMLFARAEDAQRRVWEGLGPRLRETEAPRRAPA